MHVFRAISKCAGASSFEAQPRKVSVNICAFYYYNLNATSFSSALARDVANPGKILLPVLGQLIVCNLITAPRTVARCRIPQARLLPECSSATLLFFQDCLISRISLISSYSTPRGQPVLPYQHCVPSKCSETGKATSPTEGTFASNLSSAQPDTERNSALLLRSSRRMG